MVTRYYVSEINRLLIDVATRVADRLATQARPLACRAILVLRKMRQQVLKGQSLELQVPASVFIFFNDFFRSQLCQGRGWFWDSVRWSNLGTN